MMMLMELKAREELCCAMNAIRERRLYYNSSIRRRRQQSNKRARFVVFLSILLERLHESGDFVLEDRVKAIVLFCTQRNRMGDSKFMPLVDALELRLVVLVGEADWRVACIETRRYFALKKLYSMNERVTRLRTC
jgi:hypothetical protein